MPINYSKWDNLTISDDSDAEEATPSSAQPARATRVRNESVNKTGSTSFAATQSGSSRFGFNGTGRHGASAQKSRRSVALPVEIWLRIFYYYSMPLHLWLDGRRVNHLWRTWIPKVSATKYLRDPRMLTILYSNNPTETEDFGGVVMAFSRFDSNDWGRCIFAPDGRARGSSASERDSLLHVWTEDMNTYLRRSDLPPRLILLKGRTNDTELPNLRVDIARREISFDWLRMFHAFFREAREHEKRNRDHSRDLPSDPVVLARMLQQMQETDPARAVDVVTEIYSSNMSARKTVRRERLRRLLRPQDRRLDVQKRMYKEREARNLRLMVDVEGEHDLVTTAEDAEELRKSSATQSQLEDMRGPLDWLPIPDFALMMEEWEDV